jgi:hypothetical protein
MASRRRLTTMPIDAPPATRTCSTSRSLAAAVRGRPANVLAAAERKEAESDSEDEGEEEHGATVERERRVPKQKKDPNGAVGALAHLHTPTRRTNVLAALPVWLHCGKCGTVCGLSKPLPHIDVDSEADSLSALQHPRSRCRPTSSSKSRIARRFAAPLACWRPTLGLGDRWLATAGWTTAWPWGSAFFFRS